MYKFDQFKAWYKKKLNIVCFIRKVEIDGKLDIIIKTTKFGNKFYLTNNKDIEKIVENYNEIIIELQNKID